MTCYIPPIDQPEAIYRMHVKRFDPEKGGETRWETYEIPWVVTMTVMEALEWLWDQGHYIAFRANCREFTCGSCAMIINGKARLACDTPLADDMRVEPLNRYPVLKDLVVDQSPIREKWRELELWPHKPEDGPIREVPKASSEGWHRSFSRCIECYCCLDACAASISENSGYIGPMWMLQIARASAHPLDGIDRLSQAERYGLAQCVSCFECADVCPVSLSAAEEIHRLRRDLAAKKVGKTIKRLVGRS